MKNVCAVLLLTCAGTSLALAAQSFPGEKWKVSNTMQMSGGMSMPAQTSEFCKEPGGDAVPIQKDDNCEIYDNKHVGNVVSFKMRCTGKDKIEGSAQFTYQGNDRYTGKMEMTSDGETMVMTYEGQKLGQCDGTEINFMAKKWAADAEREQKKAEQAQIQRCHEMAAEADDPFFLMQCKDPADKRTYCDSFRKPENFTRLSQQERRNARFNAGNANDARGKPLTESARVCGVSLEEERARQCKLAEQKDDLRFIANECAIQAQGIAAAQCAGRRYTAIAERYRGFCSEYASNQQEAQRQSRGSGGVGAPGEPEHPVAQDQPQDGTQAQPQDPSQEQPQTAGDKAKGLFNKGKKALGGLFSN